MHSLLDTICNEFLREARRPRDRRALKWGLTTMNDQPASPIKAASWFKAVRSADALELICANPNAYALAAVIAHRANYRDGFNAVGLGLGEALIGDYNNCGMTRQQHRTALAQLVKWKFAITRTTNKGTIARLIGTRLFEIIPLDSNHQATIKQPSSNH